MYSFLLTSRTLEGREDGFRDRRGRLSRGAKRHFVDGKVVLRQWQSGTLSMAKWYFAAKSVVLCCKKVVLFIRREEFFGYPPHFGDENLL